MQIKEGYIDFKGYKTYYRVVGAEYKKTPLLFLHGGPGSTHNSFEVLDRMADLNKRPLIMYDQIGCGNSFVPGKHPDLFNRGVWCDEIDALRAALGLKEIHLLGHSWGGMLEIIYMCDRKPQGVFSLTLSSTLSSASLWKEETHRLINEMDERDRTVLLNGEKNNDFESEAFKESYLKYVIKHIGRNFPKFEVLPDCLTREKIKGDEAYLEGWGPSEFSPTGNLADYEYTDRLSEIKIPVLIMSGAHDESTPLQNKIMRDHLPNCYKWVLFNGSRHMSYFEENEKYISELTEFLNYVDKLGK